MQERFSNRKNSFGKIPKGTKKPIQSEIGNERVWAKTTVACIVKSVEAKTTSMLLARVEKGSKDWRTDQREWKIVS